MYESLGRCFATVGIILKSTFGDSSVSWGGLQEKIHNLLQILFSMMESVFAERTPHSFVAISKSETE